MRDLRIGAVGVIVLVWAVLCPAEWTPIDFTTDGVIEDGDTFTFVHIFSEASVDMTGGFIRDGLRLNDTSTFNAYGGTLGFESYLFSQVEVLDSSVLNLYHWELPEYHLIWTQGDLAKIHVYGSDFLYEAHSSDWWLHGKWADGDPFTLMFRGPFTRPNVILHEIPEPGTILLLALGGVFLRRQSR